MSVSNFSVPVDIPWKRIAFSKDMMDEFACDRSLPLRWRSSVAVFEYEPPEDQQEIEGFLITYLKVSCSITGYQPNGVEIQIRDRIARSGWAKADSATTKGLLNERLADVDRNLGELVNAYYPCYGAMLEVVVAPPNPDHVQFKDYPYFVDFDPKKREMYEQVTDTGESMSRSLDDVNVRKGKTTLQSHEVRDKFSIGAEAGLSAGGGGGLGGKISAGYESTTTDLSQRSTENVRTTDAARENRETLSHTTQINHLYQLLNSYHIGTNRAAFFVLARPHANQVPSTFVNGPREIEGIQDFMLVVMRPVDQKSFCVEAYLETAHLIRTPKPSTDLPKVAQLTLDKTDLNEPVTDSENKFIKAVSTASKHASIPDGYEVDLARDGSSDPDAGKKGGGAGYRIDVNNNKVEKSPLGDTVTMTWDVVSDHATLNVECLEVIYYRLPTAVQKWTGAVDVAATIFLKKRQGATVEYTDQLLLTARAVCSCEGPPIDDRIEHLSVVHERILTGRESLGNRERLEMTIRDANQYSANIRHEMMQSITSSDRYPRGAVSLLDTQLFANTLGMHLETADRAINPRLSSWAGDAEDLARRVARYAPRMTRSGALQISLPDQVQRFGLSFDEALTLRRALADLPAPQGRPPEPEDHAITVPQLSGRYVDEARTTIIDLDLDVGSIVESDNQLATGMVIAQDPPAGTEVDPGTEVHLTTSTGLSVILPNVVALPLADAMCALLAAGLRADPTVTGPTGPETRVAESEPQVGTPITPNASVTLRLRAGGSAMKDAGLLL